MNLTIMRRIRFCAGHRLLGHGGKCEFFHGHNYVAEFYVSAERTDQVGRVIDFAELKRKFKGWIDQHWDHGFVLSRDDQNGIAAARSVEPSRYYLLPYNPTAENMARYLLEKICPELLAETGVVATKVVLWESEEACAQATFDAEAVRTATTAGLCGTGEP